MVAKSRRLSVSVSPQALSSLDEILDWNIAKYGADHAHRYIAFLKSQTAKLETEYHRGKSIPGRRERQFITVQRRRKGHGHVVAYEVIGETVHVLNYFHTAQDWRRHLRSMLPKP